MKTTCLPLLILGGALALGGCAPKAMEEAPAPDEEETAMVAEEVTEMSTVVEEEVAEEAPSPVVAPVVREEPVPAKVEEKPVETVVAAETRPEPPLVIPQEEYRDIEQEPVGAIHPDSAAYLYMIHPGDYLSLIAYREYGNANEWRQIYRWNQRLIGENPNLIYPYRELSLYKPEDEILDWSFDYTLHVVESGETLWSIAGQEFGDELAWIVLFWDNEDIIKSGGGMLRAGMELRVRTRLWPES